MPAGESVTLEDAALVVKAQSGDDSAFDELVSRHRRTATAVAVHLLGDIHGAEDAVQDALAVAYEKLRALRDPARFKPWFYTIVHRTCVRQRRHRNHHMVHFDPLPELSAGPEFAASDSDILEAINSLPLQYRELLAGRYLAELSYEQLAEVYGMSVGALRVRVCRAKRRLRKALERLAQPASEATRCEL